MGALTVRKLDETVKRRLRERAAKQGVSMESSARALLLAARPVSAATGGGWRLKASLEELLALSAKPGRLIDAKASSDEMWDEGLR